MNSKGDASASSEVIARAKQTIFFYSFEKQTTTKNCKSLKKFFIF